MRLISCIRIRGSETGTLLQKQYLYNWTLNQLGQNYYLQYLYNWTLNRLGKNYYLALTSQKYFFSRILRIHGMSLKFEYICKIDFILFTVSIIPLMICSAMSILGYVQKI
jgi:hypothetical protein